jgi:hypothetical protein
MKYILLALLAAQSLLVSCGSKQIKNDTSMTNDADARFESVFTSLGPVSSQGTVVYQFKGNEDTLKIYTLLSGTYEIRSDSCNFIESGNYSESEVIEVPLRSLFIDNAEKLCMVTVQINPEIKDSQVALFPRYVIAYLQMTSRELTDSKSLQLPVGFNAGTILDLGQVDKYRLIKNCVLEAPAVVKESTSPAVAKVEFSELSQKSKGSCYYSLVYTKEGKSGRYAFSVSLFDPAHSPLKAEVKVNKNEVVVSSEEDVSICIIDNKSKRSNACKASLKDLPAKYLIQVHTNKRSYYEMRSK